MTSIGGRPIFTQTARYFSTAPAAAAATARATVTTASRLTGAVLANRMSEAAAVAESAPQTRGYKGTNMSYGEWTAAHPGATRAQRTAALQRHLGARIAIRDHHLSNTMYDLQHSVYTRPLSYRVGPAVGEGRGPAASADGLPAAAVARASRLAAGGKQQRVDAIQQFMQSTRQQSRPVIQAPHRWKENDVVVSLLRREPSFGIYGSASTVEPLGSDSGGSGGGLLAESPTHGVQQAAVAGWAVTTVGSHPVFSVSRWLQQSSAAARQDPTSRRAAIQQFLDQADTRVLT